MSVAATAHMGHGWASGLQSMRSSLTSPSGVIVEDFSGAGGMRPKALWVMGLSRRWALALDDEAPDTDLCELVGA